MSKMAVAYLKPHMERTGNLPTGRAGRVVLATVKGDVHDIGKNIVAVVMACNGYEIVDLGVMVPAEDIVAKALELHPDLIGLSGLITPSLEEMVHVVTELKRAGVSVPVMIGGATTSRLHTALKIAPAYDGPVIWVKDASQNALVAARFLNPDGADALGANFGDEDVDDPEQRPGNHGSLEDLAGNVRLFRKSCVSHDADGERSEDERGNGVQRVVAVQNALNNGHGRSGVRRGWSLRLAHRREIALHDEDRQRKHEKRRQNFADSIDEL